MNDKERIAELADAFNRVCGENADFVAESIKTDRRIAELQNSFEDAVTRAEKAENRIAELEAELTMRREQAEGLQNQWVKDTQKIVALEAEVKQLREALDRYSEDEMLGGGEMTTAQERRLSIALPALKESECSIWEFPAMNVIVCIRKALAQIEEKK